jgi:ornithine cyclodeaminase
MLVLSRREVETLLDPDRLLDAVATAMASLSAGRASMPRRAAALVPERQAMLAVMPAFLGPVGPAAGPGALVTKAVSLFPENTDRPTHQAVICCFDPETGSPLALMDGTSVTAARTAAGSALATRLLARPDARIVTVIGTGVQARTHALAHARLAGVSLVRVAGRSPAAAEALVAELRAEGTGVEVEAAAAVEDAVRSADVVCATTHADRPVVLRQWLRPGAHVNSVGYNTRGEGEVDLAIVRDALVVVESRDSALAPPPAGAVELLRALDVGDLVPDEVVEIGTLVGAAPGSARPDGAELTLYKSVGVAVQDAAAAALVLAAARAHDLGTDIPF